MDRQIEYQGTAQEYRQLHSGYTKNEPLGLQKKTVKPLALYNLKYRGQIIVANKSYVICCFVRKQKLMSNNFKKQYFLIVKN